MDRGVSIHRRRTLRSLGVHLLACIQSCHSTFRSDPTRRAALKTRQGNDRADPDSSFASHSSGFEILPDLIAGSTVRAHSTAATSVSPAALSYPVLHDWKQWISFRAPFLSRSCKGSCGEGRAGRRRIFIPHLVVDYEPGDASTTRNGIDGVASRSS